jgi:hypothetical protein
MLLKPRHDAVEHVLISVGNAELERKQRLIVEDQAETARAKRDAVFVLNSSIC